METQWKSITSNKSLVRKVVAIWRLFNSSKDELGPLEEPYEANKRNLREGRQRYGNGNKHKRVVLDRAELWQSRTLN